MLDFYLASISSITNSSAIEKSSKSEALVVLFKLIRKISDSLSRHLSDIESKFVNLDDSLLETETFVNCLRREVLKAETLLEKFVETFERNSQQLLDKMDLSRIGKVKSELKEMSEIDEKWNKSILRKAADQIFNFITSLSKSEKR
jgi:Mg2+ and Co2+ transporter CorA